MAQPGRVPGSGPGGRRFESSRPDQYNLSSSNGSKQPTTVQSNVPPPPHELNTDSIDKATLELLAAWKAEDATGDAEKLREADEEIAEFKKAMNENRAATGARMLFP